MNGNTLVMAGLLVILLGFILIFAGTALQSTNKTSEIKTSGVILIGPIPIIFGSDKSTMISAVILAIVLMITAYFLFYRGLKIF